MIDEKEIKRLIAHWIQLKCSRNMTIAQIFETAFRLGIEYGYIAGENNPIQKSWEWIPTAEKLPTEYKESKYTLSSEPVLVTWERPDGTTIWGTSQLINGKWDTGYDEDWSGCQVTAWMPIPKTYEVKKEHCSKIDCEPYKPICSKGYTDCINDPAYIKYYYPDWYAEMYKDKTPEEIAITNCSNKHCFYDNEDK